MRVLYTEIDLENNSHCLTAFDEIEKFIKSGVDLYNLKKLISFYFDVTYSEILCKSEKNRSSSFYASFDSSHRYFKNKRQR